jgi:hypothetical protein
MAEVDPKVMKFVEDTLRKSPRIKNAALFERVKESFPFMGELTSRQFNARYPLQVKRRRALARRARSGGARKSPSARGGLRPRTRPTPGSPRDAVRQVFLDFATDLAAAEDRKELVTVLAQVDAYVEQVVKSLEKT